MPLIRDGRDRLTIDTNEPRLPQGSGPVERFQASPQRLADLIAERAAIERAEAERRARRKEATEDMGVEGHWARKRAEKLPAIVEALRATASVPEAASRLDMTHTALSGLIAQYRIDGTLPADVDEKVRTRKSPAGRVDAAGRAPIEEPRERPTAVEPGGAEVDVVSDGASLHPVEDGASAAPEAPSNGTSNLSAATVVVYVAAIEGEDRCSFVRVITPSGVVHLCDRPAAHDGPHRGRLLSIQVTSQRVELLGYTVAVSA